MKSSQKSHAICVLTAKISIFLLENLLNTYNFTIDSTYFVGFQALNAVFPVNLRYKSEKFEQKSENLKNPRWRPGLWTSICLFVCHANQLYTTWYRLIEIINKACYMKPNFQVNPMNCVESRKGGGGGPIAPPPPSRASCKLFFF